MTIKLNRPLNTSVYPYLTVRYRNTVYSEGVGQIVDLINETGLPKGRISLHYLPIFMGNSYNILKVKLPSNNIIFEVDLWMRNYKNNTGTHSIQIDYIYFSSNQTTPELGDKMRLISFTIPFLLSSNYIVSQNYDVENASIVFSIYDKTSYSYVEKATNIQTFIFLNNTVSFPSWGSEWKIVEQGIISGNVKEIKVVIIGIESFDNRDVFILADRIYKEIYLN